MTATRRLRGGPLILHRVGAEPHDFLALWQDAREHRDWFTSSRWSQIEVLEMSRGHFAFGTAHRPFAPRLVFTGSLADVLAFLHKHLPCTCLPFVNHNAGDDEVARGGHWATVTAGDRGVALIHGDGGTATAGAAGVAIAVGRDCTARAGVGGAAAAGVGGVIEIAHQTEFDRNRGRAPLVARFRVGYGWVRPDVLYSLDGPVCRVITGQPVPDERPPELGQRKPGDGHPCSGEKCSCRRPPGPSAELCQLALRAVGILRGE